MSKVKFVVPDAVTKDYSEPMTPGTYTGTVKEIRQTAIRSGRHEGIPSFDVAVQMEDGRYIWKVIPQFGPTTYKKLSEGDKKWVQMSTGSFAKTFGIDKQMEIDSIVGQEVVVLIGIHQSNGYGVQNSIVKFVGKA
jgi:hypothetical protein